MTPALAIGALWLDLVGDGPLALGLDIATSSRGTANPSALAVLQRDARRVHTRLVVSWKTADPHVTRAVCEHVLSCLRDAGKRPRRLCVDASSERFFAADLRTSLAGKVAVELIAGGQKLKFRGEELDAKTLLGNLYVSALEDGFITLPAAEWLLEDHRLVRREAGGFQTETSPEGRHGDTFDAGKLAYWGLQNAGGPVKAEALQVGGLWRAHDDDDFQDTNDTQHLA